MASPYASEGEAHDEEQALLAEENTKRYETERHKALIAYSNLRSVSIAMLLCVALFLSMLSARLELRDDLKWPVYIDFIPLFILPILVYVAAVDFAATRLSPDAALGKVVIVATGFLSSFGMLMLFILICLRLTDEVTWRWTSVMFPFWMGLFFSQLFFCFLIPGFLRNDMLKLFFGSFLMVWMTALTVLLAALKLDGEMPGVHWWALLVPVWAVLVLQVVVLEKRPMDVASRLLLLVCGILLPLRLDSTISWHWATILLPPIAFFATTC
jgi:hypothetical protein